jgi:hypothetical protein
LMKQPVNSRPHDLQLEVSLRAGPDQHSLNA